MVLYIHSSVKWLQSWMSPLETGWNSYIRCLRLTRLCSMAGEGCI